MPANETQELLVREMLKIWIIQLLVSNVIDSLIHKEWNMEECGLDSSTVRTVCTKVVTSNRLMET